MISEPETMPAAEAASRLILTPASPVVRGLRLFSLYSLAMFLTCFVSVFFADLLWRTGWSGSRTILLVLFFLLFFFAAIGFMHALYGFVLRRIDLVHRPASIQADDPIDPAANTAILFPIYNEDITRVYEGLRITYNSLKSAGQVERFDFFILSDSTDPEKWIEEEKAWQKLIQKTGGMSRIYYRRRVDNEGKKSGNIREFLSVWGQRYRYFITFDADSVMHGRTIVNLVNLMEANPASGLIQTVPGIFNARSLFGRMQQFSNRFYTPIFIRGLDHWSEGFANYWGHNAIIRTETFMKFCALPQLPGRKPFGGFILSHDFVEAALLLRENSQVWLAWQLDGSYEEGPPDMIENAKRDRRWCQGNLQHMMVLGARGLHGISRIHLVQGIFGYLASPLWLAFLVTFYWMWLLTSAIGLSQITVHSWMADLDLDAAAHAFLVFLLCMGVLLVPRVLAVIDAFFDHQRRQAFGGMAHILVGTIAETAFSTLHAPLQMLWHTRFVFTILRGKTIDWGTQTRTAEGNSWAYALRQHWWQTAIGLGWGGIILWFMPNTFFWFLPLFLGMALAIPLSVFTSRARWGDIAKDFGLFLTPEETSPPPELVALQTRLALAEQDEAAGPQIPHLIQSVVDPYLNAIHVSMLREAQLNPESAQALAKIGASGPDVKWIAEKLIVRGFDELRPDEKMIILSDADSMAWMHRQIWLRPETTLAPSWRQAISSYCT
ncbi:MAG TPA: glucans biosynthesis glucosyltransferase MdoH [Verrucomicrobiae bacterium]|jgi:membrane glycosyltransferase|nr:glucans biosynthesis glucosyltransferase MdoH [Verrucomicrobiae bacterium]